MADQKKKAGPKPKADLALRDEVAQVVSEQERQQILAEQAPRVAEAEARLAAAPPQAAQPQVQPVQAPADRPLTPDETGGVINALRQHEPFKTMHALITKNARSADQSLKAAD